MAVDVEWQDEGGKTLEVYGGPPLTWDVLKTAPAGTACVRFIDPCGDTTFNQRQIEELVLELEAWANAVSSPTLRHLATFAKRARGHVHTYLKFVGD